MQKIPPFEENPISAQSDSARVRLSVRVGFWAAIIFAILLTAFNLAYFGIIASTAESVWIDATAYASSFQMIEFVPQMIGFPMLPTLLVLFAIHQLTHPEKQIWSLAAVLFCAGYVLVVLILYFIEVGYVLPGLMRGDTEGLAPLIFKNPRSLAFGINYFAWGFLLGLSLIFLAIMFQGSRLALWIRWLLIANGTGNLLLVPGYMLNNLPLQLGAVASWLFGLPAVMIMLAGYFKRLEKRS